MNFDDIARVNGEIKTIDLKGKNYAMVPERVTAFRKLFPEGFIKTEIISHDGTTVLMQAIAGYYDNGVPVILGSGFAQEVKGRGMVNGTSYIENCETSAVGRALGMVGLGINGGGICSAEELVNAIKAQDQNKKEGDPRVAAYLKSNTKLMMDDFGIIDEAHMRSMMSDWKKALVEAGVIADVKFADMTLDQAEAFVDAVYKTFRPSGEHA